MKRAALGGQEGIHEVDVRALEALYDGVVDVVFFVKDRDARYVAANRTLVERCGLEHKADLLGRTAAEVFGGPLGASYTAQDRQVIATERPIAQRLELHLYGTRARGWCLTWKQPLFRPGGGGRGLVGISRDLDREDQRHPEYGRLAAAVETLRRRYDEPLRVGELARRAGFSMDRFERLVKEVFHVTPRQLLAKTRVDAASLQLLSTRDSVAAIAAASGYGDHSAFTRQFKALVGLTPREFRAHHRSGGSDGSAAR